MKDQLFLLIPKRWQDFQHYKDRCPPWIKLHRDLLNNKNFMRLPTASKALAPMFWLLASESKLENGAFDASDDELEFRLRMSIKEIQVGRKSLIDNGFFAIASNTLADCNQVATPEESRGETETETETEENPPAKRAAPTKPEPFEIPEWVNPEHWATWHSCPKRRKATNEQKQLAVNKLDAWRLAGQDFAGALENAAVGGYQGLFLPDKPRVNPGGETAYQRSMREKMEVMAPAIAAKAPGVPRTNPNNFFDALPNAKPLEITQ